MKTATVIIFCLAGGIYFASALEKGDSPEKVLAAVAPDGKSLRVVPDKFLAQSKEHRRKTIGFWRGDLNADKTEDMVICAIEKISEVRWDGYLVIAEFRNGEWRPVQTEKFEYASGPSIKDFSKEGFLIFFQSFSGELPLRVRWDAKKKRYALDDLADAGLLAR